MEKTEQRTGLQRFELEIPPDASSLSLARMFAATVARGFGCDEEVIDDIKIAVSEVCTNAIKAHERAGADAAVVISVAQPQQRSLRFEIADEGDGFGAREARSDLGGMPDGNLGLLLIESLFPSVEVLPGEVRGTVVRFSVDITAAL